MSSFFSPVTDEEKQNQQGGALQAPVSGNVSTTQQNAPSTGAGANPVASGTAEGAATKGGAGAAPAATPGSQTPGQGGAGTGSQAPKWINLTTFLGAQSPDQTASTSNAAVAGADKNAAATNAATQTATQSAGAATKTGTNTGSVGAPTGGGTFGQPSYDLSHVNLAGYTGPSADKAQAAFNPAAGAATKASSNAAALSTGQVAANPYDNALATATPAWSRVLNAVGGEQTAAQNAGAASNAAAEGVNQATNASNASVLKQKADLGAAATNLGSTAAARQKVIQGYGKELSSEDPKALTATLSKLAYDQAGLQGLGMNMNQVQALRDGLRSGKLTVKDVQASLGNLPTAANSATGYTSTGADQANTISGLLKNGAAPVSADQTGGVASGGAIAGRENANQGNLQAIKSWADWYNNPTDGGFREPDAVATSPQVSGAITKLKQAGYSDTQIAQMTGLSTEMVDTVYNAAK